MAGKQPNLRTALADLARDLGEPPPLIPDPEERAATLQWALHLRILLGGSNDALGQVLYQLVPFPSETEDTAAIELRCRQRRACGLSATPHDGACWLWDERAAAYIQCQIATGVTPGDVLAEVERDR